MKNKRIYKNYKKALIEDGYIVFKDVFSKQDLDPIDFDGQDYLGSGLQGLQSDF